MIGWGGYVFDFEEVMVEVCEIVEVDFVIDCGNFVVCGLKYGIGLIDLYFGDEFDKMVVCEFLKIVWKGSWVYLCYVGCFFECEFFGKMGGDVIYYIGNVWLFGCVCWESDGVIG